MSPKQDQLVITDAMLDLFVEMEECRRLCPARLTITATPNAHTVINGWIEADNS
jgi:hypothetical protein